MDLPQQNLTPQPKSPYFDPMGELAHITQEMYKKNMELNERNKILALLRKIDEIVLSSVTDLKQVAQQVANLLTEVEFRMIDILLLDDNVLIRLATSSNDPAVTKDKFIQEKFTNVLIPLTGNNLFAKAISKKQAQISINLYDVFYSSFSPEETRAMQDRLGVKSIIVYPLIVRDEIIGILVIGIIEEHNALSVYKKDLIDRLAGVVGIALDNSLLYQSIQNANERLKQLDKLKDEFVSLASHELRTPMTIIKSYLWLFLSKKKDLTLKEKTYIERAYESTERLINLVNDMLNVSRIESGRLSLKAQSIQVVDLIDRVVAELVPRAKQLGLNLIFTKPATVVLPVNADPERIEQVMINLIGNSLKFTPSGGTISVVITTEEKDLLVKVADNGRGMSKESMSKLFQKFSTMGDNYLHKQEAQGTGLGLYLSKSLIEMHGGKMWAESGGEGKGATFSFTLPYTSH